MPWYLNIWWQISVMPPAPLWALPVHTFYLSLLPPVFPYFPPHHFSTFLPPPLPGQTCKTAARLGKWSTRTSACLDCDQICNVQYGYSTLLHRTHYYTPWRTITHHHSPWHTMTTLHTITCQYTPSHTITHQDIPVHATGVWSFWIEKVYIYCSYRSTACNCCCVFCTL